METIAPYFNRSELLIESGWKEVYDSWYPNSQYNIWAPTEDKGPVEDIYIFDFFSKSGSSLQFIWADNLEQAKLIAENASSGVPNFYPKDIEGFKTLIAIVLRGNYINTPYFNTNPVLQELGWKVNLWDQQGNSYFQRWEPKDGADNNISDTYILDEEYSNSGITITIIWADSVEESIKLIDNVDSGIPSFRVKSEEELRLLIKMSIG